jgi:sterol desaturase/sphingolipid hydroxylase (fatty acid hydroxylase superfamily)
MSPREARQEVARGSGAEPSAMRLFESDALERLTRTKLATVPLLWIPLCTGLLTLGISDGTLAAEEVVGLIATALLAWTLFEYVFHRLVFHLDGYFPNTARFCFMMHGSHHLDPGDAGRRLTPPVVSLPIFAAVLGLAFLAFGRDGGVIFGGAFGLAYVAYDVTHYGCHEWRLPGPIWAYLKRHHLAHHFVDDARNFGVTSPLWDWVFGTRRVSGRRG